jgi:hypothetical protein
VKVVYSNLLQVLYCLGAEDESVVATPSKIDEVTGSLFSMTIPQAQSDKSKGKEPVQHLYEKDVGRKILKKVCIGSLKGFKQD